MKPREDPANLRYMTGFQPPGITGFEESLEPSVLGVRVEVDELFGLR